MKPNEIKEIPHVDEDGYFDGMVACMADAKGSLMLGADCYDIAAPEDDVKHFFKLSADKNGWVAEAIPQTVEECVGIVLDHHKQTKRIHKLRTAFDELTKNSTTYRLVQDPETTARSKRFRNRLLRKRAPRRCGPSTLPLRLGMRTARH